MFSQDISRGGHPVRILLPATHERRYVAKDGEPKACPLKKLMIKPFKSTSILGQSHFKSAIQDFVILVRTLGCRGLRQDPGNKEHPTCSRVYFSRRSCDPPKLTMWLPLAEQTGNDRFNLFNPRLREWRNCLEKSKFQTQLCVCVQCMYRYADMK